MSSYEIENCIRCGRKTFCGDEEYEYARPKGASDAYSLDGEVVCEKCYEESVAR